MRLNQNKFFTMDVFCTDLSEKMEFDRLCYHYKNIYFDDRLHLGIWRMTLKEDGKFLGYEVVKGVRHKQPDGSFVYYYPGDEDFGINGFYSYDLGWCLDKINWWSDVE